MKDSQIAVGGGRELAYTDIGDPGGACLLFFHGAPMSRLQLAGFSDAFAARGLRVVSPDRPGYGRSSPQPGRSLADWPKDVAALADALGIDRFLVAGHSSGGPYAVAGAALLGDRVRAGAVVAGVTDMGWPGAWDGYFEEEAQLMRLPDERAAVARWPFDPGRIRVPIEVVCGELDAIVPIAHSRHTAERIPGSSFRMYAGHGHLTLVSELPAIASALARSAG